MFIRDVNAFFKCHALIKKQLGETACFDTDLTTLEIFDGDIDLSLSPSDISSKFKLSIMDVKSYLVVNCMISNYLRDLILKSEYEQWDCVENQLVVTSSDHSKQYFDVDDINQFLIKASARYDLKFDFKELEEIEASLLDLDYH